MEYKRNIYLFLIFDFLTNLSPLSFIYALFLKQQNISLTQIGFIISVYQISKLIFEIPSGVFSDKYGRKTCAFIGQFSLIVFLISTLITRSYNSLLLISIIRGISFAFLSGTADCIFSESILKCCPDKMDYYMGVDKILFYCSIGLSSIIGGFLAGYSYATVFYFDIAIQIICFIFIFIFKETRMFNNNQKKEPKECIRFFHGFDFLNYKVIYLILLPAILAICFLPYEDYYSVLLKSHNIAENVIGFMFSCVMFSQSVFGICAQKINSKLGYDFSVRKLPFIIVTLFIIMSIFQGHILLSWLLYVCCASLMSINNISYNSCLQKSIEDTNRGTILSLRSLLIAVTGMLISPLVGHFSDIYGFSTTFLCCGIICLSLLFITSILAKEIQTH